MYVTEKNQLRSVSQFIEVSHVFCTSDVGPCGIDRPLFALIFYHICCLQRELASQALTLVLNNKQMCKNFGEELRGLIAALWCGALWCGQR
jgi:hypothetical protein